MIYKDQLLQILKLMRSRRDDLKDELQDLPEGMLYSRVINDKQYFYNRLPKTGKRKKEHRYSISKDPDMIHDLIRKVYIDSALGALDNDIDLLEDLLKNYMPSDEVTLTSDLREKYPGLNDWFFGSSKITSDRAFGKGKLVRSEEGSFLVDGLTSTAADGTKMRSKGELYIASRLDHFNIPYVYEKPLGIPEVSFVPDFTVYRPSDNKVFYWEHFGDVNNRSYMNRNSYKLEVYERYGIVPWDNLIITYDRRDGGLNAKIIDAMIQGWLL